MITKHNDNLASPLSFKTAEGRTIGQFYNSRDQRYHLAEYVPYWVPPRDYLCGLRGNLSPSRADSPLRRAEQVCPECAAELQAISGLEEPQFKARFKFHN